MKQVLHYFLAVFTGVVFGSLANMLIISVSTMVIPLPNGADNSSLESLEKTIHLFQFQHFIMPFLAHALGSLIGGAVAAWIAPNHKLLVALTIGVFFMIGGTMMVIQLPSPIGFNVVDLSLAYIPMAFFGYNFFCKFNKIYI